MPFAVNSLAQLELMPGPPPTMRAMSRVKGWASRSLESVMLFARL